MFKFSKAWIMLGNADDKLDRKEQKDNDNKYNDAAAAAKEHSWWPLTSLHIN